MEPVTTTVMIGGIVAYLGKQLAQNKSLSNLVSKCTDATVNWTRKLFGMNNDQRPEPMKKLIENPDSEAKKSVVEGMILSELEDDPNVEKYIKDIFEQIKQTAEGAKIIKNIVNAPINAGGNVIVGDNNKL